MKIAIFGASGATGQLLTERCLAAGYTITALVRKPEAFALRDRVRLVQGSAFDGFGFARRSREPTSYCLPWGLDH